jgi:hypothetical protein
MLKFNFQSSNLFVDRTVHCEIFKKEEALEIATNKLWAVVRLMPPGHKDLPKAILGYYPMFHIQVKGTSPNKKSLKKLCAKGWQIAPMISVTQGAFALMEEMEYIAAYKDGTVVGLSKEMFERRYIEKKIDHILSIDILGTKCAIIYKGGEKSEEIKQEILNHWKEWA